MLYIKHITWGLPLTLARLYFIPVIKCPMLPAMNAEKLEKAKLQFSWHVRTLAVIAVTRIISVPKIMAATHPSSIFFSFFQNFAIQAIKTHLHITSPSWLQDSDNILYEIVHCLQFKHSLEANNLH